MVQLSEARLGIVRRLIEQAPDAAVRNLLRALAADGPHDASLTRVQHLLEAESADRNARNAASSTSGLTKHFDRGIFCINFYLTDNLTRWPVRADSMAASNTLMAS